MTKEYFVYVDEAGDEGFGKLRTAESGGQSRWLLLGGIVVSKENDVRLPQWRDEIRSRFPRMKRRDLHFQKLKHEQKVLACDFLSQKKFGACVICSDKSTIPHLMPQQIENFKQKGRLYNYLVRYFLERIGKACVTAASGSTCKVTITFSKRAGTDYAVMRDYLLLLRRQQEGQASWHRIDWAAINPEDIRVEDHSKRAGLQIADIVTSATYNALEPNNYGYTEPRYAEYFQKRYIRSRGCIEQCGVTLVPNTASSDANILSFLK